MEPVFKSLHRFIGGSFIWDMTDEALPGLVYSIIGQASSADINHLLKVRCMIDYLIREISNSEYYLFEDFLYDAIFQRDPTNLLPKDVIQQPELKIFINNFGQLHDNCLVAAGDDKVVGAVWARILSSKIRGFGNIDNETPEFAISVNLEYRNKGIGTVLMKAMLELLKSKGYKRTSLAVQKDNYALKLYQKVGFEIIGKSEEEYLLIHQLEGNSNCS